MGVLSQWYMSRVILLLLGMVIGSGGMVARSVNISLFVPPGVGNAFHFSQLAVFDQMNTNIAPSGTCSSRTYRIDPTVGPMICDIVIDGTEAVRGLPLPFYHASDKDMQWVVVDFGADVDVSKVVFYNRDAADCCDDRIDGANIALVDFNGNNLIDYQLNSGQIQTFLVPDQTSIPTAVPTAVPTAIPTAVPTVVPTSIPTATPTTIPTAVPTAIPTAIPTSIPTATPTAIPTAVPTAIPTTIPTFVPTAIPTTTPTAIPATTVEPTAIPAATAFPTVVPTNTAGVPPTVMPTAMPTANSSLPMNQSNNPKNKVVRKEPIAEEVSKTSSAAMMMGAVTSAATQAATVAHAVRRITCFIETDDEDLELFIHPLRFPVAGSYWAGAIVGGVAISIFIILFHKLLHVVVMAYTSSENRKSVIRKLRYPSAVLPPLLLFVVNIATCSVLLLKAGRLIGFAVLGICWSIAIPVVVMWLFKLDDTKCQFTKGFPKGKLFVYFLGDSAWESTEIGCDWYVEANGLVFDSHTEQKWTRGHYFLLEFWLAIPVVLVIVIDNCDARGWLLFAANTLQILLILKFWIYSSTFLTQLLCVTCLTTCLLIISTLGGFEGEAVFAQITLMLCVVRSLYDVVTYFLDVFFAVRELKLRIPVGDQNSVVVESLCQSLLTIESLAEQSTGSEYEEPCLSLRPSFASPGGLNEKKISSVPSFRSELL